MSLLGLFLFILKNELCKEKDESFETRPFLQGKAAVAGEEE